MKKSQLPEIDLARIASLPNEKRRKALESHYHSIIRNSYAPLRACYKDLFNTQLPLFEQNTRTPFSEIENTIRKLAKSAIEIESNINVAKEIFKFSENHDVKSKEFDFGRLFFPFNISVSYWLPYIFLIEGAPTILFIDPRKGSGLNQDGRKFVFSVMHEHIRVLNPDYRELDLAILQFNVKQDGGRSYKIYNDSGQDLLKYQDILEKSRNVYGLWWQIQSEQESKERKSGGSGTLL